MIRQPTKRDHPHFDLTRLKHLEKDEEVNARKSSARMGVCCSVMDDGMGTNKAKKLADGHLKGTKGKGNMKKQTEDVLAESGPYVKAAGNPQESVSTVLLDFLDVINPICSYRQERPIGSSFVSMKYALIVTLLGKHLSCV